MAPLGHVERPFTVWVGACVMAVDTDASRPGRSCTSAPGLADQKDTDRLMDIMPEPADSGQPTRPSLCPLCAMYADNGVLTRAELTTTATYLDAEGHMWSVTWLEVA